VVIGILESMFDVTLILWLLYSSGYCPGGGGIEYLSNPGSYAGWSFYTPVRASQARQVE